MLWAQLRPSCSYALIHFHTRIDEVFCKYSFKIRSLDLYFQLDYCPEAATVSPAPVLQTERLLYVVDLLLSEGHPVLLAGGAATGKSAFVEVLVEPHHPYMYTPIHPAFSTTHFRLLLSQGVQSQPRDNPWQHRSSKGSLLFLLEDLHLAAPGEELGGGKEGVIVIF